VQALWGGERRYDKWPTKTLNQLQDEASTIAGYKISPSTIRSTIYGHPELFVRAGKEDRLIWKLTERLI